MSDALLGALLVVLGAVAWGIDLNRPSWVVDVHPLALFPTRIGSRQSQDIPLESSVERILKADFQVQRAYLHAIDPPVLLYVGYYGTSRGGRPEHTPRGCYVGAGFGIERAETVALSPGDPSEKATEYLVERGGHRQLVLFWYRSYRRTGMTDGFGLSWDRLVGRLSSGRADGALVRLSTPILGPMDDPRARLAQFAVQVDSALAEHWPREFKALSHNPVSSS